MTKKKPKKLTDGERASRYARGVGLGCILRWPLTSVRAGDLAGLRAGRREKPTVYRGRKP